MSTQTQRMYVHAYFDKEGKFHSFSIEKHPFDPGMGEYGMWVKVGEFDVTYEVPDNMKEVNVLAAAELEAFLAAENGKHQMRMMKLQATLNSLRGLEYSNVLDKPSEARRLAAEGDDDIPF